MGDDEKRHDLDQTVIRLGGRDYTASRLLGGAGLLAVAVGLVVAAAAADMPLLYAVAVLVAVLAVGTARYRP